MDKKNRSLLIKISIPIIILVGGFGIEKFLNRETKDTSKDVVVVCPDNTSLPQVDAKPLEVISKKSYGNIEGLSDNFGFFGEDEAVVGVGISNKEFYNKYIKDGVQISANKSQELYKDARGTVYKLNLSSLEKKPLNIDIDTYMVRQNTKTESGKLYHLNSIYAECIYDLKNDTSSVVRPPYSMNEKDLEGWSVDGECWIGYSKGEFKVYNYKDKSMEKVELKRDDLIIRNIGFFSENRKVIYFVAQQNKSGNLTRQGIFRVNVASGKIEEVLVLSYVDKTCNKNVCASSSYLEEFYILDGGKRIVFRGKINGGKRGLYIYNTDSEKFNLVVPDTEKLKPGLCCWNFWVSPDKTKIIYTNLNNENGEEQWDIYGAKINGDNLTSKVCLYKDIVLSGSIQWSADSKKILFFAAKSEKKVKAGSLGEITYKDKNEVNIITFK